jgi:hypothetical protein
MSKLDNRIYTTICEVSLERFKKSKFLTYVGYCRDMGVSMNDNSLSRQQKTDLILVIEMLQKIYSLDFESIGKYMKDYFNSDNVRDFEKAVVLTQETFPFLV